MVRRWIAQRSDQNSTNILVGSQLLLGGSAVVTALTGMNVYAAIFLIPVGRYTLLFEEWSADSTRCVRVCNSWRPSSDFPVRLLAYVDLDDHYPILHVPRLRHERTHWLTKRHVRPIEQGCYFTTH